LGRNVGRGFTDLALYETGLVFRRTGEPVQTSRPKVGIRPSEAELAALEATLPYQPLHLAVVLAGMRERSGWWGAGRPAVWGDAIDAARTVAAVLGLQLQARADTHSPWHPGRCAALELGGRLVGHAGELHPRVVESLELPTRTCAMELRLDDLLEAATGEPKAPSISAFPPASFDLALVVDATTPAADVADAVRVGAGPLLEDLRLFDVFEGTQVGPGRKSLAFALRLRAPDRTLTAEETAEVRQSAVREAEQRCGAALRGA
jgi:phenylalanyl-tRNA synthetase beta chain